MDAPRLTRFLRRDEVERLTGLKRTALRDMCTNHEFPRPIKLSDSGRAIGWLESDLLAWQQDRIGRGRVMPG